MTPTPRLSPRDRRILFDAAERVLVSKKPKRLPGGGCYPCAYCVMMKAAHEVVLASRVLTSFEETASVGERIVRVSIHVFDLGVGCVYGGNPLMPRRLSRLQVADYLVALAVMG